MSKFWWTVPVAAAVMSGLGFASIRVLYPPPRLACDGPNFEFGVVEPGVELTHTFLIRNNGGRPLRIYSVESTSTSPRMPGGRRRGSLSRATTPPRRPRS
jgi:hypothetical protein